MQQRFFALAVVLSFAALAASSSSHAQNLTKDRNEVKAKVAFDFHVGDKLYPAGSYRVLRRFPMATSLVITNGDGDETSMPVIALLARQDHFDTPHQGANDVTAEALGQDRANSRLYWQRKYRMAPMWLSSFFENDKAERTNREIRWRRVPLSRSTWLVSRDFWLTMRWRSWGNDALV